jgi:hypothetical protein
MPIQPAPPNPPTDALPPIPIILETPPNLLASTHGTRTRVKVRGGTNVTHDDCIPCETWGDFMSVNHRKWTRIRESDDDVEARDKDKVRTEFTQIYQGMAEHQQTYILDSKYPYFATQRIFGFWAPILSTLLGPFQLQLFMEDNGQRRPRAFWCDIRNSRVPHASEMDAAITAAFLVA